MEKTDKEVLELCKAWFEDIMERSDRLTSGNVSHGSRAIHGVAKNYAECWLETYRNYRWWLYKILIKMSKVCGMLWKMKLVALILNYI